MCVEETWDIEVVIYCTSAEFDSKCLCGGIVTD